MGATSRTPGSLRGQLLRWLLGPMLALVALNTIFVYRNALDEVEALLSQDLVPLDEGIVQPPKIQTPY